MTIDSALAVSHELALRSKNCSY
jgi:hypothetical protein